MQLCSDPASDSLCSPLVQPELVPQILSPGLGVPELLGELVPGNAQLVLLLQPGVKSLVRWAPLGSECGEGAMGFLLHLLHTVVQQLQHR